MNISPQAQPASKIRRRTEKAPGRDMRDVPMARYTRLAVGGKADILFIPADPQDLATVLANTPPETQISILGSGANTLIRDGGIRGMVVRLGRRFADITAMSPQAQPAPSATRPKHEARAKLAAGMRAGAAAPLRAIAAKARDAGIAGLEFLHTIPGTLGGALAMNAGAAGCEIADIFVQATALDRHGNTHTLRKHHMGFGYRCCTAACRNLVFLEATLQGTPDDTETIRSRMEQMRNQRAKSQPTRIRTAGSTFKNPNGTQKAWQLIQAAGCKDIRIGGASLSPQHCNFLVNDGTATAKDLETLAEAIRTQVREKTGVRLEWEIVRMGEPATGDSKATRRTPKAGGRT